MAMDAEQPAIGAQRPHQRRDHPARLEGERRAGAIGMREQHEVEVRPREAAARDHLIQHELLILAVDDQHGGGLRDRMAARLAHLHLPMLVHDRLQGGNPFLEIAGRRSLQRHLMPGHRTRGDRRGRLEPGRIGIIEIGDDQHRGRVLLKAVRHLLQHQSHILDADFLGDGVERQPRIAPVGAAHQAGKGRAVARAAIEQADGRRRGLSQGELLQRLVRNDLLLRCRVHEHQIFLAIVVESEAVNRIDAGREAPDRRAQMPRRRPALRGNEAMDAVHRLQRDPAALLEPRHELAVIHGLPAEGGLRDAHPPTCLVDLRQQGLRVRHGINAASPSSWAADPMPARRAAG